ncbi:SDR family oxidoreductase [Nonomuraea sp. NPDC049695]|uniref:SDR family oxidoreductase n=1 Tax=Nonomuraea sp. NPDC049695 TaxID=3154734 RepID=UPI00342B00B6
MSEVDYDAAVAIIGMAGRLPLARNVEEFWDNLMAGRNGLRRLSEEELLAAGVQAAQLADPAYVRVGGPLEDVEMFDAPFFGFSRVEAEAMDPQHRLLLEVSWEALERSGYPPMAMPGRVGVFAGSGYSMYALQVAGRILAEPGGELMMAIGTERDSLSSLLSYKLDLRGPSVTVQTFCSTSLVAVHLAAQSLLNFECEFALAGGAFVQVPHGLGYSFQEGGILAPDGVVRAFDADARGSVIGNGVSVVVLKRLSDAIADNDHIDAVILGSAVNNDGRACAGYTAPGVDGQASVIEEAISFAGVGPETIGYVECHGTGTMLGDSIELAAMARAFPKGGAAPVVLGSVKPSIGHLDRASGSTSLIRAALALSRRTLPGTSNFATPNPELTAVRERFTVLSRPQPWPERAHPRRAGVSSFGLGGTNAHVVLEEPPARPARADEPGPHLLVLSARDKVALEAAARDLAAHLTAHPDISLQDVAFTLRQSRAQFPVRMAVVAADVADACRALEDPGRPLTGETRVRDPLVDLHLGELDRIPDRWWRSLAAAVGETPEAAAPARESAITALVARLRELGCSIGRVLDTTMTGSYGDPAAEQGSGPAVRIDVAPSASPDARAWFLATVAKLWMAGATLDWAPLDAGHARRVPLPTYPFQRRRYWIDATPQPSQAAPPAVQGRTSDLARWTYLAGWRHEPAVRPHAPADREEDLRKVGPWLVLAAGDFGEELAAGLQRIGADTFVVRPSLSFGADGRGGFTVRPDDADDLREFLRALPYPPRTVVHTFGLTADEQPAGGTHSVIALAGALAAHLPTDPVNLLVVTENAVSVAGSVPSCPSQAALGGLLTVLAQENPGWRCRHVDIDVPSPAMAGRVLAEAVAEYAGPIALRGSGRWARSYDQVPLPPVPDGALPPGSVVMITGGLGHVGLILARHLTVRRGCRVALTTRTEMPGPSEWRARLAAAEPGSAAAERLARLVDIVDAGGDLLVLTADATDEAAMTAAVQQTLSTFGRIDLVVHAAVNPDPAGYGPAHMVSRQACQAHFPPKVDGFHALRKALNGSDVRGITLSSLSAVLGGLALGPYAAVNAALDQHVMADRLASGARWITVDWDTWGSDSDDAALPVGHTGAFDMTPEEAADIFERAVAVIDECDHLVISTGSLDERYVQWVLTRQDTGAAEVAEEERDPRPDISTPFAEPREGVERTLADIWMSVLRLDSVGVDDDFYQLGGNSVLAISLIAKVRKELGIPVPVTAMLGYPTIRGLVEQLAEAGE